MKRILSLIFCIVPLLPCIAQDNNTDMEQMRKLVLSYSAITNLYVDKVEESKVVESAIRTMLKELDPHSTYLTAKEVEKMNEPLQGNFEGLGVQFLKGLIA